MDRRFYFHQLAQKYQYRISQFYVKIVSFLCFSNRFQTFWDYNFTIWTVTKRWLTKLPKNDKIALFLFTRSQYTPAAEGDNQGDESPSQLWHKYAVARTNLQSPLVGFSTLPAQTVCL